ncbi:MAG TPA: peptide ABC transporter substrate-binding protein [Candidatus Eremiobacteraceae bacterium]|jgi:peptide/nickel transport system substrate-binding protein|nr:peptide ABC transporter substrate-binding protein [Candidatus Eremiobacteraceae bacterium]
MIYRYLTVMLAAALLGGALAGCTKISSSTSEGGAGGGHTIHGVLRMGNNSEPDNMNPVVGNQQIEVDLSMFWGGYLLNWTDQNKFIGELAMEEPTTENGGISKDGLSITYHLRKGVKWQDGPEFTADDVIYTWQQIMNPKNNVSSRVGYDVISKIEKKDPYTIVVHLTKPFSPFVASFFTMSSTPYPVLPKHLLAQYPNLNQVAYNNKPVGTGPFIVTGWEKGSLITMEANPNYWRGAPKLKSFEYHIIPNENTLLTELQTHEIDMTYNASASQYEQIKRISGVKIDLVPFTHYGELAFNMTVPALQDKRVRQALTYATDCDELIQKISHGVNVPADSDQPAFLWAHNDHVKKYPYDVVMAGKLLDQAGWTMGSDGYRHNAQGQKLSVEITGSTGRSDSIQIEEVVQAQWRKVGVDVPIKNYLSPQLFASYGAGGILQTGKFDVGNYSWINGVDPDNSTLWMCNQFPPAGQNVYHLCDKQLDDAENIALTKYDIPTRKKAYDIIADRLADEQPAIFIWFVRRIDVYNTDLQGYKPAHAGSEFWNTWEWSI